VTQKAPLEYNYLCADCGNVMTEEEKHYYEYRCEGCEQIWYERLQDWRAGGSDPELDEMFSEPKPNLH